MNALKKVLITGVSGQDGSLMADYLMANTNYKIYGLSRTTSVNNLKNIIHLLGNTRFNLINGDISDPVSIDAVIDQLNPHYVINFAGNTFVGDSWKTPHQHIEYNTIGVLYILESIKRHSPNARFYQAGSSEMFGKVLYSPQDEDHPFRPQNPYGVAKCAAHYLTQIYRENYKLYAISGCLFNHESERRGEIFLTRKCSMAAARIRNELKRNEEVIPLELGNIFAKRDWSYAPDFVEGIWRMLNQENFNAEMNGHADYKNIKEYVLSSNEIHAVKEFVELAFKVAEIEFQWINEDKPEDIQAIHSRTGQTLMKVDPKFFRQTEVDLLRGDSSKIRAELGWKPKTSFLELVEKMVHYDIQKLNHG